MGVIDGKTKIINDQSIPNVVWAGGRRNNWNNSGVKSYLNSTYYNTIDSSYKKMIAEATYYLGGPNSTNYKSLSSSDYYDIERNSTAIYAGNPSQVTQYIGLMYPSDFGYAGGNSCINSSLYNYSNSCQDKNYLNNNQLEWLITPISDDYQYAMALYNQGGIISMVLVPTGLSIRPVLYLTDSTNIIDGTGSSSNPFILSQ